jgi:hypothetical protein
MFQLF